MRKPAPLAGLVALCWSAAALAAGPSGVTPPPDVDVFSKLAIRAEADDQSVDFRAMRLAWLDSAQRRTAPDLDPLRQKLNAAVQARQTDRIRDIARQIASADYIDLVAHFQLRQACIHLDDKACADHEHFVEFGLLDSITQNRNGTAIETAWPVVSIDEEDFILGMIGAVLRQQSLLQRNGRAYDAMEVSMPNGSDVTFYFDVTAFYGRELG
jgi:hypothetical protein